MSSRSQRRRARIHGYPFDELMEDSRRRQRFHDHQRSRELGVFALFLLTEFEPELVVYMATQDVGNDAYRDTTQRTAVKLFKM